VRSLSAGSESVVQLAFSALEPLVLFLKLIKIITRWLVTVV
jgi:hypothetical protein